MKALKLTTDKKEKLGLRSSCKSLLDEAERIKTSQQWSSSSTIANPQSAATAPPPSFPNIELWANGVTASTLDSDPSASRGSGNSVSHGTTSELSLLDLSISDGQPFSPQRHNGDNTKYMASPNPLPARNATSQPPKSSNTSAFDSLLEVHNSKGKPKQAANTAQPPILVRPEFDSVQHDHVKESCASTNAIVPNSKPSALAQLREIKSSPSAPATSSNELTTRIRKLMEPASVRIFSKKEEIILLRASKLNGFTFPPWRAAPDSAEFTLADGAELFVDTPELGLSSHQLQFFGGWARAEDALPPPEWFPGSRENLGPVMCANGSVDLVQDAATDCSVVASLCASVARSERGHAKMLSNKIWPYDKVNDRPLISPNGKYIVRLNFNGCWRKVIIDDRLPLSKTNRMLHVVDRKNPALLWPALLEKAYLKVRGGYDFPGSNSCSDLWALTGWIPEQIYLQEGELVPSQLWTRLYNAFLYGDVLVTVGTGKMTHRAERELGLEGQHNYVILDMKETDHEKLFLVKNPWVEGKGWRGSRPVTIPNMDATSSDSTSRPSGRDCISPGDRDKPERLSPGTYWIGLDNVVQHFESLYLNWNPGLFSYRQDIHFSWDVDAQYARASCIIDHPQFSFNCRNGGIVWFLLCRHFRNAPPEVHERSDAFNDGTILPDMELYTAGNPPKGYMSIYIYDRKGESVYVRDDHLERGPEANTPQSLLRWECKPRSTYTLAINQDDLPPSSYTFTLSAFSNSDIALERAIQKYPIQTKISGCWTTETAGGNTHSPKYFDNPQFSLKVSEHTPLAILIQTPEPKHPIHVKLTHGQGKRMLSLQSRDIIVDSGEHRNGCAFAEVKDISPGTYTVICSVFEAGKIANFSLRVDSTTACELKPIPRDGAGFVSTKLADACFGSTVNKIAAPIIPRRLVGVTVIAKFLRIRSPRSVNSPENEIRSRSPLRVTIELGRGPERILLACSSNGEYSDAASVRTEKVDLSPNMLYSGDLWLVLDRLSGPGYAVEELYEVELLADAPNAFDMGIWRGWDD
ncbi:cysteine proteinase [Glonium stellatum]|uniref:Cysteine proteinase n=1 Tax=Glonium stellatum TaxID=574774 RepID=A0A8E2EXJ4_9PEZI|nr:cysteine proteinase [Glonium stellatum]